MSRGDGGGEGGRRGRRRLGQNGFEDWAGGYMGAKKAKLEDQFLTDVKGGGSSGIFEGVAIFVNGYTDPSADELKRLMMMNGGIFHHYFNSEKTTHIIATNLPDTKVKALKGDEPICNPRWITDSLEQKKLLDFRMYLLYSSQSKTQPKINFLQTSPKKQSERENLSKVEQIQHRSLDANDSRFLGEFYNNSRLHHISSMGANFKRFINELREKNDGTFPLRDKLHGLSKGAEFVEYKGKVIMHIDMDCFFVSVGLRKRPDLIGQPVAVAHAKGARPISPTLAASRKAELKHYGPSAGNEEIEENLTSDLVEFSSMSELASVSYEARARGVKNGMFLGGALKLCSNLKTIPYDFEGYQEVAHALYNAVASYTLDIQAMSCDEMLVDITEVLNNCCVTARDFSEHLRAEIHTRTQCHASVGLGSSLLLARMATRKAKPNGCFHLADEEAVDFMKEVPVRDLPGVGRKTENRLREMQIEKCRQLQALSLRELQAEFGSKTGETFYSFCRGLDNREINLCQERKSVSAEVNYGIRFKSAEDCSNFFDQLAAEVQARMEKLGVTGKSVTVKLMVRAVDAPLQTSKFLGHGICDSVSKSSSLSTHTDDIGVIRREVKMLLRQLGVKPEEMRGVGIQVTKLAGNTLGSTRSSTNVGVISRGSRSILSFLKKMDPMQKLMEENKTEELSAVSFSQLDQEVFAALPDDIKKEIETAYGQKSFREGSPQPGPSGGDATRHPETRPTNNPIALEMTFSQVDPEYFAALPDDLKREVEATYGRKMPQMDCNSKGSTSTLLDVRFSQVDPEYFSALPLDIAEEMRQVMTFAKGSNVAVPVGSPKQETAFDKIMQGVSRSPAAKATPPKRAAGRRGRPPKNSPRFIKCSDTKKLVPPATISRVLFGGMDADDPAMKEDDLVMKEVIANSVAKPEPNLEGYSDIADVRLLLAQWLQSVPIPTEDDIETVSKYLQELVFSKSLDKLMTLVRMLWRKTSGMSNPWKVAYVSIINNVQLVMIQNYGYRLFTNFAK